MTQVYAATSPNLENRGGEDARLIRSLDRSNTFAGKPPQARCKPYRDCECADLYLDNCDLRSLKLVWRTRHLPGQLPAGRRWALVARSSEGAMAVGDQCRHSRPPSRHVMISRRHSLHKTIAVAAGALSRARHLGVKGGGHRGPRWPSHFSRSDAAVHSLSTGQLVAKTTARGFKLDEMLSSERTQYLTPPAS